MAKLNFTNIFDAEKKAAELLELADAKSEELKDISVEGNKIMEELKSRSQDASKKLSHQIITEAIRKTKKQIESDRKEMELKFEKVRKRIPKLSKELAEKVVDWYD